MKKKQTRGQLEAGTTKGQKQSRAGARGQWSEKQLEAKLVEALGPLLGREVQAQARKEKCSVITYVHEAACRQVFDDKALGNLLPGTPSHTLRVPLTFEEEARLNKLGTPRDLLLGLLAKAELTAERPAAATSPATEAARPAQGWAEQNGYQPGTHQQPESVHEGDGEFGWRIPLPGLPDVRRWSETEVLNYFVHAIIDAQGCLGRHVLPRLATAYDVAEFADMLWTAQAIAHSVSDEDNQFSIRDDLGDAINSKESRLVDFLQDVLLTHADVITRHGLPNAGPRNGAKLAEALALAELRGKVTRHIVEDRRRQIQEQATPLQRQAWEKRARAWLWRDCWDYRNRDLMGTLDGLKPEGKGNEVAA